MNFAKQDEWLKNAAEEWPGAKLIYKPEWDVYVFLVAHKIFGMYGENTQKELILTVKGLPHQNEELVEMYSEIKPGYHMNKSHWISLQLRNHHLEKTLFIHVLKNSYTLVFDKLPIKIKKQLKISSH
ncbi:MmcQ/YjbR family DNA-binding protein [Isobaculum melis]|uniref:Predicted DNA-binding protein, MmcQ/YjbR family n=1 Tax=Isobaculum melis TaxID=142588 RepID=A0A1H9RVJ5_9LACT|nr:MmcQ/YjbR family DNA-binding protein [Isobaculum melis]SER76746.1 Predicted DNA-binding protein, MmcQ/YjbR family [Isobaculum melis]